MPFVLLSVNNEKTKTAPKLTMSFLLLSMGFIDNKDVAFKAKNFHAKHNWNSNLFSLNVK